LEDILIIYEKHRRAAREILHILNLLTPSSPHPRIKIAIGGESGSGKSVVAHMISKYLKRLKIHGKIIHTDDFYIIPPKQRDEWRRNHSLDRIGFEEYDWEKIDNVIHKFDEKKVSSMPCIDLLTDQVDTLSTDFAEVDILIIEGLYATKVDADVKVFIDITYIETKDAQKLREKEDVDEFRLQILEREHQAIKTLKKDATILIDPDFNIIPKKKVSY
jgi:uridine kinase